MKKLYFFLVALLVGFAANAADWYLVGANYGWSDNATYGFTKNSDGTYKLTVDQLAGEIKIKKAGSDWSSSFGTNGNKLKAGELYTAGYDGTNISVDGVIANATITINVTAHTVLAVGAAAENEYDKVYLVGDFGSGWSESVTNRPLTLKSGTTNVWEGTYELTATTNYFKMKAGNNVYATGGSDIAVELGKSYTASMGGNAFTIGAGNYDFTFVLDKNADTGVLTVKSHGSVTPDPDPTPDPTTYTVKFVNGENWAEVCAYIWDANDRPYKSWPGEKMTKGADGVYSYSFTSADFTPAYVIFNNNNNGKQTDNLEFENGKTYTYGATPTPDPEKVFAVAGSFNEWSQTANSTSTLTDNCAIITVNNWSNGSDGFKFVIDGKWYSNASALEVNTTDWYNNLEEKNGEGGNMTLPATCEGKTVVFTIAADNLNFKVEVEGTEPEPGIFTAANIGDLWKNVPDFDATAGAGILPAVLTVKDAVATVVTDQGTVIEDATGACLVADADLEAGKVYNGTITGVWYNAGTMTAFMAEESELEATGEADVTTGKAISEEDFFLMKNAYRLVTFTATEEAPIVYQDGGYMIGETIKAGDMFQALDEDFEYPANLASITGIIFPFTGGLFTDVSEDQSNMILVIRSANDLVEPEATVFAVAGSFNDWSQTANSTSELTDNCAIICVENWTNGEYGFKFLIGGKWYSNASELTVNNTDWYTNLVENSEMGGNMTLPESCEGKTVVFTIAADNLHFNVEVVEAPAVVTLLHVDFAAPAAWTDGVQAYVWTEKNGQLVKEAAFDMIKLSETSSVSPLRGPATGNLWALYSEADFEPENIIFRRKVGDNEWAAQTVDAKFLNNTTYSVTATEATDNGKFIVENDDKTTGIDAIGADNSEAVYYNLQGVRVDNPAAGMYIVVRGGKTAKVYVK